MQKHQNSMGVAITFFPEVEGVLITLAICALLILKGTTSTTSFLATELQKKSPLC